MKDRETTCAKFYRIFLLILLTLALSGGVWYCWSAVHSRSVPEDGTLVQTTIWTEPEVWL